MPEHATTPEGAPRRLRVALVAPYGEPRDGFFADSLLAILAAEVQARGHEARVLRVYYDGDAGWGDETIGARFELWLRDFAPDLVAFERLFDPVPIREFGRGRPSATTALVWRGDSFEAVEGVDLAIGALPGLTKRGTTRRTPTVDELVLAFVRVVEALASGRAVEGVPGVARFVDGVAQGAAPLERPAAPLPFRAVAAQEVIAPGAPPTVVRKTIFGNAGCPYGDDPLERPEFTGIRVPGDQPLAKLGCAFCFMGGDYEKRPDAETVARQVEQALFWTREIPSLEELVLTDQAPVRYLGKLVDEAAKAGVRPVRWLFPARADTFLKELPKVREAARIAASHGHVVELYLTGFESFSDAELGRYNKGLVAATLLQAVDAMRALASEEPAGFAYARAQGHSLILWSPWTTVDDLQANVDALRTHGLGELFTDVGRNRLRLYRDLPVFWAAERDGLVTDAWEDDDEGAARRKGYSVEIPWKFRHPRTRLAYHLVRALRDRLGPETELSQLAAVVAFVRDATEQQVADPSGTTRAVLASWGRLEEAADAILAVHGGAPTRRAVPVGLGGGCNNGCESCAQRDRFVRDPKGEVVRAGGPVVLAGREPTLSPILRELLASATKHGPVAMVTNGRRFAHAPFTKAVIDLGLRSASVKLFGPDAATHDAIARDPGSFEQACAGIRNLARSALVALEVRFPLRAPNLAEAPLMAGAVASLGVRALRVELDVHAIGLGRLDEAVRALSELRLACESQGISLGIEPPAAGAVHPSRVPA